MYALCNYYYYNAKLLKTVMAILIVTFNEIWRIINLDSILTVLFILNQKP